MLNKNWLVSFETEQNKGNSGRQKDQKREQSGQVNDDEFQGFGESAAYEDTSGGYGVGGSTGNSSASDTGLGIGIKTDKSDPDPDAERNA